MSLKRRLEYSYKQIIRFIETASLPKWLDGGGMRVFLVVLLLSGGVGYVLEVSNLATTGYQLRDLEKRVEVLRAETQKIEVEIASESALSSIERRLPETKMTPAGKIIHLTPIENVTAKR